MLRLGFPVMGVTDLDRAADFWSAALHLGVATSASSAPRRTLVTPGEEEAGRSASMASASRPNRGRVSTWTCWWTPLTSRTPRCAA